MCLLEWAGECDVESDALVTVPQRKVPVGGEFNVVVVGGGSAGLAAAVSAGRAGASVLLVERLSYLGGMSTAGLVGTFCGLYVSQDGEPKPVVEGLALEILARLEGRGGLGPVEPVAGGRTHIRAYDLESLKVVADELVVSAGVEVAFGCRLVDLDLREGAVEAVLVETKQGLQAFRCGVLIDASGDADAAWRAGATTELGSDGFLQLPSMMFKMANVGTAAEVPPEELRQRMEAAVARGAFDLPRLSGSYRFTSRPGEVRCNMTRISLDGEPVDPTDWRQLSRAERIGRQQVEEYARFLCAEIPGFEDAYVSHVGAQLGVRESRRVLGDYQLTEDDVLGCRRFNDVIARNAWPLEIHRLGANTDWRWLPDGQYHELPFRALTVRGLTNVLTAGRCVSATHEAMASIRVIGNCYAMGQAAGTAAALAQAKQVAPREVGIAALQEQLRTDGALL